MGTSKENLDTAEKLILFQGISLIQDGLQFLEWTDIPNTLSYDALELLKGRFRFFKDCVLDGDDCYHLIIDRMQEHHKNIKYDYELNKKIQKQLEELRERILKSRK